MAFRVRLSEKLMGPLPATVRQRIWLTLSEVATAADADPTLARSGQLQQRALEDGYRISFTIHPSEQTVSLIVVTAPKAPRPEIAA